MLRIGIVAGEPSGDYLAADLIRQIRQRIPDVEIEGVGGPLMLAAGCKLLYPMEKLSVMGLVEVAGSYLELVGIRRNLIKHFQQSPPDIFIGVDAPDFNLELEAQLHSSGIRTVHYVSPSVWAWRQYRIHKIKRAVDLMLVLFPFEMSIYRGHKIPVSFVGHPLADRIAVNPDQNAARQRLGLDPAARIIAIMPGSRKSEIERMLTIQLQTVSWCAGRHPELVFITSVLTDQARRMVERITHAMRPQIPLHIYQDRTDDVLAAADLALLTSGTITLEAMLHNLPMVVGYRVHWLTYRILRMLIRAKYAALPNLLTDRPLVAEFLQYDCQPEAMGAELVRLLENSDVREALLQSYAQIRNTLQQHAGARAAMAVLSLLEKS